MTRKLNPSLTPYNIYVISPRPISSQMARSRALNQLSERDIAAIDLPRVLERLERKILGADADARLWHNPYERAKTSAVSDDRFDIREAYRDRES